MRRMELNHWFVKENGLSISLLRYHVSIEPEGDNSFIMYIVDGKGRSTLLNFKSLEEAVIFTEKIVDKSNNHRDIIKKYLEKYQKDDNKIELNSNEVKNIISDHFSKKLNTSLECDYEVSLKDIGPAVTFFLGKDRIKLEEKDLEEVFSSYANEQGYGYEGFKYIGGIHKVGYYFDQDTPYFEGIEISVNKEKNKVLKYNKK